MPSLGPCLWQQVLCSTALWCCLGCGRVNFEAGNIDAATSEAATTDAAVEAASDGNTGRDASADATADSAENSIWTEPWSTRVPWPYAGGAYDCGPSLSADGAELYFISSRPDGVTGNSVFLSRFEFGTWSAPEAVTEVNMPNMFDVSLSPSGRELYTTRAGTNLSEVFVSTRSDPSSAWTTPVLTDPIGDALGFNLDGWSSAPALFNNATSAIFHSGPDDVGENFDLYIVERASVGDPWQAPTLVDGVNTARREEAPSVSPDGAFLHFNSNRRPNNWDSNSDSNIFIAAQGPSGAYAEPQQVPEANAAATVPLGMTWDEDFTVSADGRLAFVCSNENGVGTLYILTR